LVVERDELRSVLLDDEDNNRELIRFAGRRLVLLVVKPEIFIRDLGKQAIGILYH
jgi:hypothetical protein